MNEETKLRILDPNLIVHSIGIGKKKKKKDNASKITFYKRY